MNSDRPSLPCAVTKGIIRDAKMNDFGIKWLGEVPGHWEFKSLKYLVDIDSEKLKDSEDPDLELEYIDIGSVDSEGNIHEREFIKFENASVNAPAKARMNLAISNRTTRYLTVYLITTFCTLNQPHVDAGGIAYRPGGGVSS